jgi:type I restriction enzyme, S subunit
MANAIDLPKGWALANVGDLADYINGRAFKPSEWKDYGKPIIRIQNLNNNDAKYNFSCLDHEEKYLVRNDDLLFAWSASLGVHLWRGGEAWLNQHIFKVLPKTCSTKKFIFYLLEKITAELYAKTHGSGMVHVTKGKFESTGIALPPLEEQHRIVAKIDELFSKLDKGIENLKTAQLQLKVYRQALLKHASAGKGLNQKGIITQPYGDEFIFTLGDVIQTLGQGWSPRCLETPSQSNNDWGVIKTTAIQPLRFDDTKNKELPKGLRPRPHLEIIPGDVLITRAGPRTRVGIACFVKNTRPNLMVCDKAYRLQVQKEKILPQYLVMLLNTPEVLGELEKLKSGINDSGLNLTQEKFLTLKVIVPPIDHQQVILDDIEQKLTNVEFLEKQTEKSLLQAEALRQSILRKAFSGQLVSQDPNDESASILLEQIKISKGSL